MTGMSAYDTAYFQTILYGKLVLIPIAWSIFLVIASKIYKEKVTYGQSFVCGLSLALGQLIGVLSYLYFEDIKLVSFILQVANLILIPLYIFNIKRILNLKFKKAAMFYFMGYGFAFLIQLINK